MKKIKYLLKYNLFCLKWIWNNRDWYNSRQKWKAMDKAVKEYIGE